MSAIVCLLFLCVLATVQAVPPPPPGLTCTDNSQCNCDQCCFIPNFILSKKRADAADSLAKPVPVPTGTCQRYRKLGEDCSPFSSCGCASGLQCHFEPAKDLADPKRLVAYRPGTYTCRLPLKG